MEAAGYAVNPWVNAGDRADKDGNLQLRQSRLLKVHLLRQYSLVGCHVTTLMSKVSALANVWY